MNQKIASRYRKVMEEDRDSLELLVTKLHQKIGKIRHD